MIFRKYKILISKKIMEYGLKCDFDDCMQESLILLNDCINKYIESPVPFGAFYSRALNNKLISIKRKINRRQETFLVTDSYMLSEAKMEPYGYIPEDDAFKGLDEVERLILDLYYIRKWNVKDISREYLLKETHIYYIIKKIKAKVRDNLN